MFKMPKGFKFLTVLTLVFSLFFGPILPEVYAQATEAQITQAKEEFQPIYDEITSLEPLEDPTSLSLMDFASGIHNTGEWIKQGASNFWATITGNEKARYEAQYEDYKAKILEANEAIKDAKNQVKDVMNAIESGDVNAAMREQQSSGFASLEEAAKAKKAQQQTLIAAGTDIKNAGTLLENIGTILGIASAAAKLAAVLFGVAAPAILTTATMIDKIATGIEIAGALLKTTGESIISTAEGGVINDGLLIGNLHKDLVMEGSKQAITRIAASKAGDTLSNAMLKEGVEEAANIGTKAAGEVAEAATDAAAKTSLPQKFWNGLGFKNMLSNTNYVKTSYQKLMNNPEMIKKFDVTKLMEDKFLEETIVKIADGVTKLADQTELFKSLPVKTNKIFKLADKGASSLFKIDEDSVAKGYLEALKTKNLNSLIDDPVEHIKSKAKSAVGLR